MDYDIQHATDREFAAITVCGAQVLPRVGEEVELSDGYAYKVIAVFHVLSATFGVAPKLVVRVN